MEHKKEWLRHNAAGSTRRRRRYERCPRPFTGDHAGPVILALSSEDAAEASAPCGVRERNTALRSTCSEDGEGRAGRDQTTPHHGSSLFRGRVHLRQGWRQGGVSHLSQLQRDCTLECTTTTSVLQAAENVMENTYASSATNAELRAGSSTGTSDRPQQGMTWIWQCSQKHRSAKEQLQRDDRRGATRMGTDAGRSVRYPQAGPGVGHVMAQAGKPWSRT